MEEGQPSLPRSRVLVKFFINIYFRYMRGGPALLGGISIAIDYPRSRLGGLEIFHIYINGPRRRASKSKLRANDIYFDTKPGIRYLRTSFHFITYT